MAETHETHRTGGLSSTDAVKADPETEWTPSARRRCFRSKTPDPAVVVETKKLKSTDPTSDTGDSTKMNLTDAETGDDRR